MFQSDTSSASSGNGHDNRTDEQKIKPLVSILKPPSLVLRPPAVQDDSVIEMELAALAVNSAPLSKDPPKFPSHLRLSPPPSLSPPSLSPPSEPPHSSSKVHITDEDYGCGTLAFLAGGSDDDEEQLIPTEKKEKKKVEKKVVVALEEEDPMDCSTLLAMAVVNSVVEEESRPVKEMIDRSTSPILPSHFLPAVSANSNGNNSADKSASSMELTPEDNGCALLVTQYRSVLKEKRLQRSGSLGSVGSRRSLASSLSLIPESLPVSRAVTNKTSKEFPLANTVAIGNEEPVKRVSFQDQPPAQLTEEARLIGRPLPTRPLPPIGVDPSLLYNDSGLSLTSPRSSNRPLPPLAGMGTGNSKAYDTLSLHSAGSSTYILPKTASTNSLPNPDPRYSSSNVRGGKLGGARRKTPPPPVTPLAYKPLPSIGISNLGERTSPRHDAQ